MAEFLNRIFGRDVHQSILNYFNEMKARGGKFAREMKFSGKLMNPSQAVFGFSKSEVGVKLDLAFEVADDKRVYLTDAVLTPDVPWFKKYFFFCKQGKQFSFPSFPSVAELRSKWCRAMTASSREHPDGGAWCQTDAKTLDDYFMYGDPYPESLQECSVVRSIQIYNFHFEPDSDGIDVESDIRYDLRFSIPVFGYTHLDNGGKLKRGYGIGKYFAGGLMLGGAYEDFKKLLAKTKASMDCTPALEGLLQAMLGPKLVTR